MARLPGTSMRNALAALLGLLLACGQYPDPLDEIRILHARGGYAQSVDRLREIVDDDPSRGEAHLLLGVALLRSGQSGLAIWPLHKAADLPELAVEAGILLAQAMLQSRTAPDALAVIDRVLARAPDDVDALVLRVHALLANAQREDALVAIDRVLALDPENLEVLVPRMTTLVALERVDDAEAALAIARERMEARREAVPSELHARLCIAGGLLAFGKGDVDAAETAFSECLAQFPTDPLTVSETLAFYQQIGRPERIDEILEQGMETHGGSLFRMELARRKGALGDTEAQERLLREEAEVRGAPAAWLQLAEFHARRDEYDRAIESFEMALQATPSPSPMLRFAYADTLVQAGRYEDARAIARDLETSALRDLIHGRILLAEGDPHGALASFEAGIALWPNNAAARYLAGQAAERTGDFARAATEYRESLRANAALTEAGLELARLESAHGDHAAALAAIHLHAGAHPRDPEVLRTLARVAWRAGERRVAADALTRLRRLPEQAATAVALHAELLADSHGSARAVEAIEGSDLDLTSPSAAPALRVLLASLTALGEHARAEARLAAALSAHPDSAPLHEIQGRVRRSAAAPPDAVRRSFERALELDAEYAPAWAGLGDLAGDGADAEAAIEHYDRAGQIDPSEPTYALAAAEQLISIGAIERAAERLERILAKHPREASAALALARIAAARGDLDGAEGLVERAAWLRHPEAEATRAWIEARAGSDER